MPASALVTIRSLSPCLSVTFLLSARSNNALRSDSIDGVLRLAPLGLPLWPGLNWNSFGGQPGPTRYSASDLSVSKTTGVSEPDFAELCRGGLALPAGEKDTELGRGGDSGACGEDVLSMIAACFVRGRAISRDLVEAQSGLGMDC